MLFNVVQMLQVDGTSMTLKEFSIPLNPIHFSPAMLAAMDTVLPSALDDCSDVTPQVSCL